MIPKSPEERRLEALYEDTISALAATHQPGRINLAVARKEERAPLFAQLDAIGKEWRAERAARKEKQRQHDKAAKQ